MVGIDANVLVRYIVRDDAAQAAKADSLLQRLTSADPGYVTIVALTELIWVLRRSYRLSRSEVAVALEPLLLSQTIRVQHEAAVLPALNALRRGTADFADAVIAALGEQAGCSTTYTFDQGALRFPGFAAL